MRRLALALAVFLLAAYVALFGGLAAKLLPAAAWPKSVVPSALWEWLFTAGTLAALPICALIALKKAKPAGALLLLASAAASVGLSIHSGPRLWLYFTGFLIAILPQCVISYLLMREGKAKRAGVAKKAGTRR